MNETIRKKLREHNEMKKSLRKKNAWFKRRRRMIGCKKGNSRDRNDRNEIEIEEVGGIKNV